VFGFFVVASMMFHMRMRREVAQQEPELRSTAPWRAGLIMLYACSTLVMVRSIFRVVEYVMGPDGQLLSREWPSYVFDGLLMWAVQMIFWIWFPSKFIARQGSDGEYGQVLSERESGKVRTRGGDGSESGHSLTVVSSLMSGPGTSIKSGKERPSVCSGSLADLYLRSMSSD
jgi:hypothetical protein